MGYDRVMPRDLFNEAKLLKCLGHLHLMIHNDICDWKCHHDTTHYAGFNIQQDPSDGSIHVQNLIFSTQAGRVVPVSTTLNSMDPFPMVFLWDGVEYPLFDEDGTFSEEYHEIFNGTGRLRVTDGDSG